MEALFSEALRLNMRLIAGKVMMDRHVPDYLCETAGESYEQTRALIRRWHQRGRLGYAITPRFAPTSTPGLLEAVQRLRIGRCHDIYEQLFVLMTLGDERNISETWVNGERVWCQD